MNKRLFAAVLSLSALAFAAELKPAQEEAQDKFNEETADSLKALNEKCGTKVTLKTDFENFKGDEWSGTSYPSYCTAVLDTLASMCADRPAYKKALGKKLTSVSCLFAGAKGPAKDENYNVTTTKNMSFEKGTFTFHMLKDLSNLSDNAKAVIEKALN